MIFEKTAFLVDFYYRLWFTVIVPLQVACFVNNQQILPRICNENPPFLPPISRTSLLYSLRMLVAIAVFIVIISFLGAPVLFLLLRWKYTSQKARSRSTRTTVGIFHPYCNAGGGGEKVLWAALEALRKRSVGVSVVKIADFSRAQASLRGIPRLHRRHGGDAGGDPEEG